MPCKLDLCSSFWIRRPLLTTLDRSSTCQPDRDVMRPPFSRGTILTLAVWNPDPPFFRMRAHPPTTHRAQASPVRRPQPRAGCVSTDRGNAGRRETTPLAPSRRRRPGSKNQTATALRRTPPNWGCQWRLRSRQQSCEPVLHRWNQLLPPARTGVRFQANPPEMSRKAVAQRGPVLRLLDSEDQRNPKKRIAVNPSFEGA